MRKKVYTETLNTLPMVSYNIPNQSLMTITNQLPFTFNTCFASSLSHFCILRNFLLRHCHNDTLTNHASDPPRAIPVNYLHHPPPQRTLPQQNPSNWAADLSLTGDDELVRKTVQIDKNAGNDKVAEADDANNVIQKNYSNFNYAEANKGILATNAIESEVIVEDNKADKSHASPVATGHTCH